MLLQLVDRRAAAGSPSSHLMSLISNACLSLPQEQYTLCFELLQAYLDSFDTYANFKDL